MWEGNRWRQVTTWIIVANAVVHLLKVVAVAVDPRAQFAEMILILSPMGIKAGYVWQFFTYMWVHVDLWHLLFNMMGLHFLGRPVEERIGSARFAWLYATGGLAGGLLWWLVSLRGEGLLLGASGAVLAVVMAFAVLYPRALITLFPIPITLQARWLAVFYVVLSAVLALEQSGRIAHLAHLGGLIVGYAYIRVLGLATEPMFWWRGFSMPRWPRGRAARPAPGPQARRGAGPSSDEVDAILDKISRDGFQSLTPEERRLLEEAGRRG